MPSPSVGLGLLLGLSLDLGLHDGSSAACRMKQSTFVDSAPAAVTAVSAASAASATSEDYIYFEFASRDLNICFLIYFYFNYGLPFAWRFVVLLVCRKRIEELNSKWNSMNCRIM